MKAINVHPNQQEIYLGFASKETLSNEQKNFEVSFIGGQPIWLFEPQYKQLRCEKCMKNPKSKKQKEVEILQEDKIQQKSEDNPNKISQTQTQSNTYELSFIMQMYCPLQADHCYHRILYFFYCEHCKKNYKLFRQQADINYVPLEYNEKKSKNLKTIVEKSYQFDTSQFSKKQLVKLLNNIKIQVHQEIIQQAEDQNSQEDESLSKEVVKIPQQFEQDKNPQNQELIKEENVNSSLNVKKDQNFQVYKKVMMELNQPQLLYASPPVPYNVVPINSKHSCQQCGAPYKLQVQLTQQILLVGKSKKLALMEWGSLFGFTCVASCETKTNLKVQQLIVQYQHDPVKEEQVKQLKKKNKKRKKQQKRKSKSKSRSKSHSQQQTKPIQNTKTQQQGDWD